MIITLVVDQYKNINNGTTATARHLSERLVKRGHTVRILTASKGVVDKNIQENNIFVTEERIFPGFMHLIHGNGMVIAKADKKVMREAFEGADLVHFMFPFNLMKKGKSIADAMGIPSTAAFHIPPEHITCNIGLRQCKPLCSTIYRAWRKHFNRFNHVHTPSIKMKTILEGYGYKSNIHAISNGVSDVYCKTDFPKPAELEDKFVILSSGRLASEKRHKDIVNAVALSKYNSRIQLMFCGKGTKEKSLIKLAAKKLENPLMIKFCDRQELLNIINYSDLYVHASEVEAEAISCMEAFVCGTVPIIASAPRSASSQFALSEHNLFKSRNVVELAEKIDWMIENPQEKTRMEEEYLEYGKNFRLEICVDALEKVFLQAIEEKEGK